jgi:hypothetical protein
MRTSVAKLVALGQLPLEREATVSRLQEFEAALKCVVPPLSDEEAVALLALFGHDGCFGLSWSLVHLVETAPGWPCPSARFREGNPWVKLLLERAK